MKGNINDVQNCKYMLWGDNDETYKHKKQMQETCNKRHEEAYLRRKPDQLRIVQETKIWLYR